MRLNARVSRRGAARWVERQHPWIYRSDVLEAPAGDVGGVVEVNDDRGRPIGMALWSPVSTIALRMLTREPREIGPDFWKERIAAAVQYRDSLRIDGNAYRLVHAEADGLPSLIVDRYAGVLAVQFLSAGLEPYRSDIVNALLAVAEPEGIVARDDVPVRAHERLPGGVTVLHGKVSEVVAVTEATVRWLAAPMAGQKTGAFLDQRENRVRAGQFARGRALDAFSYHGSFALHLARHGAKVIAIDTSEEALDRARANARLNGLEDAVELRAANVFDALREFEEAGEKFDVIVLDPPAFAKRKDSVDGALRGYKEINLRALRLLQPGGHLLTFSCSWHVGPSVFRGMLEEAAMDAGRPVRLVEWRGQALDHPAVLQVPETAYLKGAVLQVFR